jgi:protein-disulfide isomerase
VLEKNPQGVKLVVKHYPLPSHRFAEKAAIAALAANKQGKFWEFHHKLFANQTALNDAKVQEIAGELGLDMEKFNRDLTDPQLKALIEREVSQARQANIRGVPSIYMNGKLLSLQNFQELPQAIENELRKKK